MDSIFPAVGRPAGEMERLVYSFDWSVTALGPMSEWPRALRVIVETMLAQPFPTLVLWGPQLVQIYNDGYRTSIAGKKHPTALGQPTYECWNEVVDRTRPMYARVLAGESLAMHDAPFVLERSGAPEETFLTVTHSPLRDDDGRIVGIMAIVFDVTERVRSEQAREQQNAERVRLEEQRELALDAAQLGWWRLDVATGRVFWDDRLLQIFGVAQREWNYQDVFERIHPDDRTTIQTAIDDALDPSKSGAYFVEYRLFRPDGALRWVQSKGLTQFEGEGEARRAVSLSGTAADVTEAKQAAAALLASSERLSLALAAAKLGDWDWDAATDVMTLSPRTAEIYGIAAGSWGTRSTLRDLLHPDDRELARLASDRALATRTDYDVEYRVVRPDGRLVWVAAKGRGVYDDDGRVVRMLGVVQDVTERKAIDQEREALLAKVEQERSRLSEIFAQSPSFVCVLTGPDHVFEFANQQYLQLVGHRDVLGRSVREAIPEAEGQGYFELLDRVYATGQRYVGTNMAILIRRHPELPPEERFLDFIYQPMLGPNGRPSGVFVHGIDVTETKQHAQERERLLERERAARTEAEQANRMKDDFLATLSHELRTPLNAIVGWSQLMRRGVRTPGGMTDEMIAEGVATIERNALAQARIIEDLLDMSRIISGKIRLEVQRVNVVSPIRAGIDTIRPAAQAKGIRIIEEFAAGLEPVIGDPARLQQVFWNLLSNAVKFTPAGGSVRVSVRSEEGRIEATVTDDGVGISAEFLPHVFDRFRQADSSTTRKHGGLGLGLAIVRQLVELHGGTIRVESNGEGHGTAFTVSLPTMAASELDEPSLSINSADETSIELAGRRTMLRGVTVLVVDDEPDGRAIAKRVLENGGASVETAVNGREALERLQAGCVDVLVSDVGMPDMDGYELVGCVRALAPDAGGSTPALALTAYVRSEDRVRALQAGFNMYLVKPVDPLELLVTVANLAGVNE